MTDRCECPIYRDEREGVIRSYEVFCCEKHQITVVKDLANMSVEEDDDLAQRVDA